LSPMDQWGSIPLQVSQGLRVGVGVGMLTFVVGRSDLVSKMHAV
jgi:hypothetical protein